MLAIAWGLDSDSSASVRVATRAHSQISEPALDDSQIGEQMPDEKSPDSSPAPAPANPAPIRLATSRRAPGRPSSFSPALADDLCDAIANGTPLHRWCAETGPNGQKRPSTSSVLRWLSAEGAEYDGFRRQYARAREMLADRLADECVEIADQAFDSDTASAARVKTAARQWYAAKLKPKVYGDNVNVGVGGSDGGIVINLGRFAPASPAPLLTVAPDESGE
jgi:hypothetical protein